jgi:hypothetical protein
VYIGKTTCLLEKRWKEHCYDALKIKKPYLFPRAIRKYGKNNFTIKKIYTLKEKDAFDLNYAEMFLIKKYKSYMPKYGYNLTLGGQESTKAIVAKTFAEKRRKYLEESKRKMSITRMAHPVSEETRKKISLGHMGKSVSEETKKRLSIVKRGHTVSYATKLKISRSHIGKKRTPEHVKNMSIAIQNWWDQRRLSVNS